MCLHPPFQFLGGSRQAALGAVKAGSGDSRDFVKREVEVVGVEVRAVDAGPVNSTHGVRGGQLIIECVRSEIRLRAGRG